MNHWLESEFKEERRVCTYCEIDEKWLYIRENERMRSFCLRFQTGHQLIEFFLMKPARNETSSFNDDDDDEKSYLVKISSESIFCTCTCFFFEVCFTSYPLTIKMPTSLLIIVIITNSMIYVLQLLVQHSKSSYNNLAQSPSQA